MIDKKRFFSEYSQLEKLLTKRNFSKKKLEEIKNLIVEQKALEQEINKIRQQRNNFQNSEESREEGKLFKSLILNKEEALEKIEKKIKKIAENLPNIPAEDNPENKQKFVVVELVEFKHRNKNELNYQQINKYINFISEEASVVLSGSKFAVYQGIGSEILHGLITLMKSINFSNGYQLVDAPYLIKGQNFFNVGQFPKFRKEVYKIENQDLYLIPTSEASLINLYQKQIIEEKELPIKLTSYSPCFRVEAGGAGKENKGLVRLHQFHKVEIIKIVKPEDSTKELLSLVSDAQSILKELKITHRVIALSNDEMGFSSSKTYDIEIWMPGSKRWLEISSCSNCTDFQSRRSEIRVRKADNNKFLPHTLNGSALAIDRLIATLVEYYYSPKKKMFNFT